MLSDSQTTKLETDPKTITVTKRTVRFGKTVYQTHNIAAFSEGEVESRKIPWIIIIAAIFVGSIVIVSTLELGLGEEFGKAGSILLLLSVVGILFNLVRLNHYGFMITLNSGDKHLFITKDTYGLKQIISVIYEFIETGKDVTYQISISNSQVSGNFIQGNAKDVFFGSKY